MAEYILEPGKEGFTNKNDLLMGQRSSLEKLQTEYLDETSPKEANKEVSGPEPPLEAKRKQNGQKEESGSSRPESETQILRPNEKRLSEEVQLFQERFQKQNLELDKLKPGWGPFQALEQMAKDHKVEMSEEELQKEAKRIRDRDFKEWGRNYYTDKDKIMLWSETEISNRVKDNVNRVKGIDVSAHQGKIDWQKVKEAGYQFAFLKATEGGDWVDSTFAANREAARNAGLAVGYYHFFRPLRPVEDQIANFVKTVGKAEPDSLRLVIDTEDERLWKPYTLEQRLKMIEDWCSGVKKELGVTPQITIYGSPNFFRDMLANSPRLSKYSLWIANYNVAEPTVPKPWTKWDFWQYTDKGKVPGINGDVDINMFHGNDLSKIPQLNRS